MHSSRSHRVSACLAGCASLLVTSVAVTGGEDLVSLGTRSVTADVAASGPMHAGKALEPTLFLVFNLEHVLRTWRAPSGDSAELREWVATTRDRLSHMREKALVDHLDEDVIRAYGSALDVLERYERLLDQLVQVRLVVDVARPQSASLSLRLLDGGIAGASVAQWIPPSALSLAAGAGGAVVGTGVGWIRWKLEARQEIARNEELDDRQREAVLELIANVGAAYDTLASTLRRVTMPTLARRYDWGDEVDLDDGTAFDERAVLARGSRDPFVRVSLAQKIAERSPAEACQLLTEAAELVPDDSAAGADVFDWSYRGPFLLLAARAAVHVAETDPTAREAMARRAVELHAAALACLGDEGRRMPTDLRLDQAAALALAGRGTEAVALVNEVKVQGPAGGLAHYRCAQIAAVGGDLDAAARHLRRSFEELPRWDGFVASDAWLAPLRERRPRDVDAASRLPFLGTWTWDHGALAFFDDGAVRQATDDGEVKVGSYALSDDGRLQLTSNSGDRLVAYSIDGDRMTLQFDAPLTLRRAPSAVVGTWSFGDRGTLELRDDGSWRQDTGNEVSSGRYATVSPLKPGARPRLIYVRSEVLGGQIVRDVEVEAKEGTLVFWAPTECICRRRDG